VAYHFQQAGDPPAPEWLTRAGGRAQRAYAWVSAAQRLRAAATALEAVPGSERERGWLLYRAARMLRIADPVEGAATLEQVMRLADVSGDRVLAGESRYSHGLLRMYLNQCDAGIAELVAGIDELQALPIEEAFGDRSIAIWQADALPEQEGEADRDIEMGSLLLRTTGIHHRRTSLPWWYSSFGRPTTAIEIGDACVEKITPLADRSGLLRCGIGHAHHGLGMAHAMLGDAEASRDHFRHARDVYEGMNHHGIIAFSYLNELRDVACVYDADSPGRRRELASEAESALGRAGGALPEGFSTQLGTLSTLVCDGEWETVRAILRDTIRPINVYLQREYVDAALALAWWENDLELARRLIDSVLPGGPTEPPGSRHHSQAIFLQRMAAMIALEANDPSTATGWLDANERWLAWSGSVSGKSEHALLRSAFNRAQGNAAQARECAEQALRTAEEPRQPLALVAGHRVLGELASERGDFTLADRHLAASAAIADACEVPLEIGLTMASLARLRHAERRTGEANSLANEAMSIFDRLGATRALRLLDPPRVDRDPATATPPPFALTPRELEVLRLLADGLTDVAIGVRLFISPRTVSHHLRSVYAKIGVSSRSGATRFALERGLIHTPPA
ncbi:MAG: LuxR C-terminal-related transcriptional regulator, partial [Thermomicrobiales bacterium]